MLSKSRDWDLYRDYAHRNVRIACGCLSKGFHKPLAPLQYQGPSQSWGNRHLEYTLGAKGEKGWSNFPGMLSLTG